MTRTAVSIVLPFAAAAVAWPIIALKARRHSTGPYFNPLRDLRALSVGIVLLVVAVVIAVANGDRLGGVLFGLIVGYTVTVAMHAGWPWRRRIELTNYLPTLTAPREILGG